MRILVISDTHGRDDNLYRILRKDGYPDRLLHLGDLEEGEEDIREIVNCPVDAVCGNCDYFSDLPRVKIVEIGPHRIFMTHGHGHFVSLGMEELIQDARENRCDIAMFGHIHRPVLDRSNPQLTILNPGSLSFPRQENKKPSYIWMEIRPGRDTTFAVCYL